MKLTGIRLGVARLRHLSEQLGAPLEVLQETIFQLVGRPSNIDSPRQVADVLLGRLGLPIP